jgi:hypothetical protein
LAARVSREPFFLGSALAAYQRRHGLDDAGLAALLGCDVAALTDLRLCRRPGTAGPGRTEEDVGYVPLAPCGDLSPSSTTSVSWDRAWP